LHVGLASGRAVRLTTWAGEIGEVVGSAESDKDEDDKGSELEGHGVKEGMWMEESVRMCEWKRETPCSI
jgi:hypothetical protein